MQLRSVCTTGQVKQTHDDVELTLRERRKTAGGVQRREIESGSGNEAENDEEESRRNVEVRRPCLFGDRCIQKRQYTAPKFSSPLFI